mmetsp:Transcript_59511/g.98227  ORF Transcript_59511/g.98227 Transcript_59511/m.98227 type:complete len:215 (-) Transcript_59511:124-768(-)
MSGTHSHLNTTDTADFDTNAPSPHYNDTSDKLCAFCYCGELLQRDDADFEEDWRCQHCFKLHNKKGSTVYNCFSGQVCKFNRLTSTCYNVCQACYASMLSQTDEQKRLRQRDNDADFMLSKMQSHIAYLENVIVPQLYTSDDNDDDNNDKDVDEDIVADSDALDKYLEIVYCLFYENFLCALNDDDHIDDDVYHEMIKEWDNFYRPIVEYQLYI